MSPVEDIERSFPRLSRAKSNYKITSPETARYNCVAWAMGDTARWWEPPDDEWVSRMHGTYWPPQAPVGYSIDEYLAALEQLGYSRCDDESLDSDCEKVALFAHVSGQFTHASRQLPSGDWTSKLGTAEDIRHDTLADLEGQEYGSVVVILKREKPD